MRKISVGDIMTRKIISVKPTATLHECARAMSKERINSIVITEKKRLYGILTARDILWAITKKPGVDLKKINVMDVATKKLAVIKPSAEISQALRKMQALNFRRLPVLSHGELIGVLTLKDILSIEPDLYSEMSNIMDDIREQDRKQRDALADYPSEGMCSNCGGFADLLKVEGDLLCPDCRDELY